MEEIEGSETVDETSMVSKLCRTENPNDKTLEAPTRVYGSTEPVCVSNPLAENNGSKFDIRGRTTDFSSPINDSSNEIGELEKTSEENRVKGDENAPRSMISGGHVSENGNFVFDNVSGPPNGGVEGNNMVLGENIESGKSSNDNVDEENGGAAYDKVENLIVGVLGNKEEEVTLCEEHKFIVGDLVWVCTKSKSWWPGLIVDPSHVCNDASKSDQNDQSAVLLVKYFGNNPTVWCSPMLLKPFAENFKEMSSQATEWVKGRQMEEVLTIKNTEIAKHLSLPPVKLHCSMLAEDAIKAAVKDYETKRSKVTNLESARPEKTASA